LTGIVVRIARDLASSSGLTIRYRLRADPDAPL
jgi:hypothetical protein